MPYSKEVAPHKLHNQLFERVKPYLTDNDSVLMCCESSTLGGIVVPLVTKLYRRAYIVTASRLISAGMFQTSGFSPSLSNNTEVLSTKLLDINSITEHHSHEGHFVIARSLGEIHSCIFFSKPLAGKFRQLLEQAVQRSKTPASQAFPFPDPPPTHEERLKRLTRLHDDKLISDAEFEQKRKAILDEL